jgi:DNA-binding ferritin-like protein
MTSLKQGFELANMQKEDGLSNYLQDRMAAHSKHAWMLRSTLNKAG